jgi:hypothetical protein
VIVDRQERRSGLQHEHLEDFPRVNDGRRQRSHRHAVEAPHSVLRIEGDHVEIFPVGVFEKVSVGEVENLAGTPEGFALNRQRRFSDE